MTDGAVDFVTDLRSGHEGLGRILLRRDLDAEIQDWGVCILHA